MQTSQQPCISCGMPLRAPSDHAAGDPAKPYCRYCAHEDGSMKTYDEVLAGMSAFLVQTQGVDEQVSRQMAAGMMAKLPAWKSQPAS